MMPTYEEQGMPTTEILLFKLKIVLLKISPNDEQFSTCENEEEEELWECHMAGSFHLSRMRTLSQTVQCAVHRAQADSRRIEQFAEILEVAANIMAMHRSLLLILLRPAVEVAVN